MELRIAVECRRSSRIQQRIEEAQSGSPIKPAGQTIRFEVWCDWDPEKSDLEEIAQNIRAGEAICTKRVVIAVVNRPQDIEDDAAMSFFGGQEGDCRPKSGVGLNGMD